PCNPMPKTRNLALTCPEQPGGAMRRIRPVRFVVLILFAGVLSAESQNRTAVEPILWSDPGDIHSKNLFWGPGGEKNQPKLPVEFKQEDRGGTSPKFEVRD